MKDDGSNAHESAQTFFIFSRLFVEQAWANINN